MKKFIFVEAKAVEQEATTYVRSLGLSPILFTCFQSSNPEYYRNIDRQKFDAIYDIDTHDPTAMYTLVQALNIDIAGVMGCYDEVSLSAAQLGEKLELPHPNIQGLMNAYFKDNVRKLLAQAGIEQPAFAVLNLEEAPVKSPIDFPIVIKPVRDAGAFGVYLCHTHDEYHKAITELKKSKYTLTGVVRTRLLIEEFIPGDFFGAELLWHNGQWNILGINKIFVDAKKSLCMVGISHPADIPLETLPFIKEEILRWVHILGLKGGVINVEFKLVDQKPKLIEINLRLAGAYVNKQVEIASGVSLVEHAIAQACGIKKDLVISPAKKYIADAFIFPRIAGEISTIDTSHINGSPIEISFRQLPFIVQEGEQNFGKILGHVLAMGKSCEDAMHNAQFMVNRIELKLACDQEIRDQLDYNPSPFCRL